jgi:hypothetical protein
MDSGRWLSFIPWLVGRPKLKVTAILVGNELVSDDGPRSSAKLSDRSLAAHFKSPFSSVVMSRQPATIFNGTLGAWRNGLGSKTAVDACILFSPGFGSHFEEWMTENDLLPLMRSEAGVGVFSYSLMDAEEDRGFLRFMGLDVTPFEIDVNPWSRLHEMSDAIGTFGQHYWPLVTTDGKYEPNSDVDKLRELRNLMRYAEEDFFDFGHDEALKRLGARWPVVNASSGAEDAIIVLPREMGILESSGAVGRFNNKGFLPFSPEVIVSKEKLLARPDDTHIFERIIWALRIYRDDLESELDDAPMVEAMSEQDIIDDLGDFISGVLGRDIGDPGEFLEQMRASGGIHGPTHPSWHDLLSTLGWDIDDYCDDPGRLSAAFYVTGPRRGVALPVVCEAYAYFPDDESDTLAIEAMATVKRYNPDGALLLFKSMPYLEVAGHSYNFGGMILWKGQWAPFSLNVECKSLDDVIDQVESGFRFDNVNPRYADDHHSLTAPFNLMCHDIDPNEPVPMGGLRSNNGWVTLLPAGHS